MNKQRIVQWTFLLAAGGLLVSSLTLPLWKMRMEAPQYRDEEALKVVVYPDALKGDLNELKTLNQYIGVRTPETLPQLTWLPGVICGSAVLGLLAGAFVNLTRGWALFLAPVVLSGALGFAALQARNQMYDIGHNRDEKIIMRGVKDFTPPFLGTAQVAQFEIRSWFGLGSYLIGGAVALQLAAACLNVRSRRRTTKVGWQSKPIHSDPEEVFA